jgi:hypothetical protein
MQHVSAPRCEAHSDASMPMIPNPLTRRQTIMEKLEIRSQAQLAAASRQFASWPKLNPDAHNKSVSCLPALLSGSISS